MTTVSVCIPTYQGEHHLPATLESVLAQEGVDLEVVVVDNASTDGTAALLASYDDPRLRVVRQPATVPMTENFAAAVAATTGEHVKLCCADDLLLPGALAAQSAALADRAISVVACRRLFVDDDGRRVGPAGLRGLLGRHGGPEVARRFVRWGINPVGEPAAVMFRRADYDAVGGWLRDLVYPCDLGTWLRLLRRGDLLGQPEPLAAFRIGRAAHSQTHEEANFRENRELMRRVLADPRYGLGRLDAAVARVGYPLTWWAWRLRRRSMFASAATPHAEVVDEHRAGGR